MFDLDEENHSPTYWPSVSDLFITLFIIAIAILAAVFFTLLPKNNVASEKAIIVAVGQDLGKIRRPINELRRVLGLQAIRDSQTPDEVMLAVDKTCNKAAERIRMLESDIKKLTELDATKAELVELQKENDTLKSSLRKLEEELAKLQKENIALKSSVRKLDEEIEVLRKTLVDIESVNIKAIIAENVDLRRQLHDQPPNIQFSEQKEDYKFGSGSSSMGSKFIDGLRNNEFKQLANEIIARQNEGRVKVDTLEIIGHTDGLPFSGGGNLDQGLPNVLVGTGKISTLFPGSNNDLGLLRALAVREQWEDFISEHAENKILRSIEIRCYSAGQTILPYPQGSPDAEDFRHDDARARRIEMRLTRLKTNAVSTAPDSAGKQNKDVKSK